MRRSVGKMCREICWFLMIFVFLNVENIRSGFICLKHDLTKNAF